MAGGVKRHALQALAVVATAIPVAAALPVTSAQARRVACASAHAHPAQVSKSLARHATLCLINRQRARHGLRPLRLDPRLNKASTLHSRNMVRQNYFDHGNFVARILRASYLRGARSWAVGENIAWGTGPLATPAQIVRGWMNSPGHRSNILNPRFRDIGVGIADGAPGAGRAAGSGATYTTDFGRRG
jgi:uncharacterized protein YkwD